MACPYFNCDKSCKTATITLSVAVVAYLGWRLWGSKCTYFKAAKKDSASTASTPAPATATTQATQATGDAQVEM